MPLYEVYGFIQIISISEFSDYHQLESQQSLMASEGTAGEFSVCNNDISALKPCWPL